MKKQMTHTQEGQGNVISEEEVTKTINCIKRGRQWTVYLISPNGMGHYLIKQTVYHEYSTTILH